MKFIWDNYIHILNLYYYLYQFILINKIICSYLFLFNQLINYHSKIFLECLSYIFFNSIC